MSLTSKSSLAGGDPERYRPDIAIFKPTSFPPPALAGSSQAKDKAGGLFQAPFS